MSSNANHTRSLLCALFLLATSCTAATGKIIYVDGDAIAEFDGSDWASAHRTLQDAISEAWYGDEIRVAHGTYRPDQNIALEGRTVSAAGTIVASGDQAATFELIYNVTFKGGYAGYGESDPNARDFEKYETILSGDLGANDIRVNRPEDVLREPSRAENSHHVVTVSGTPVLDGFTIAGGGNANEGEAWGGHSPVDDINNGGGLFNRYGTPRIINCTLRENSAQNNGGGMYNDMANPILINCTFTGNFAGRDGGAISNSSSAPNLTNCTFSGNTAWYRGGAMYNADQSDLTLKNCTFIANQARMYGAGMSSNSSDLVLTNCTFAKNSAPEGKALAFNQGLSVAELTNCILWDGYRTMWINDSSTVNVFYSNISGGWAGEGNIDADPMFVDTDGPDRIPGTADDDLRLAPLSPCVDSGDPGYVSSPNETDFDANPRITGGRIDMGAYEFQSLVYVDDDAPGDPEISSLLEDGTQAHPFDTIQEAIDIVKDGYTVLVLAGRYSGIDYRGKAITVAGADGAAVIDASSPGHAGDAVTFHTGEGPDSVLRNFVIRNSAMAISLNYGSSPTIFNVTIVDNDFGIAAYENSNPDISNCIFWNNKDGDIFQCETRYSCIEGGDPAAGNISVNPLFVDEAGGDHHLLSQGWHWNTHDESWTYNDHFTSRCIDMGDPSSPLSDEPMTVPRDIDNEYGVNRRINMGAYGGTSQASMPPLGWLRPDYETAAPEPNPTQWAPNDAPQETPGGDGTFDYWVLMAAAEATDDSGPVEYFFECTTESGFSSGWQSSRTYSVQVGRTGQGHRFRVKARDLFGNETAWSPVQ